MRNSKHPSGFAALPILAIVLVLAIVVIGVLYFANRDNGNTNTSVTTNAANTNNRANANVASANANRNTAANVNVGTNTNTTAGTNNAAMSGWTVYHEDAVGYTFQYPPAWTVTAFDSSTDPSVLPQGTTLRHPVLRYVRITDPASSTQLDVGIRTHDDLVALTTRTLFFVDTEDGPYADDEPLLLFGRTVTPIKQQSDEGYHAFFVASYSGTAEYTALVDAFDVYVEARRTDGESMSATTISTIRTILGSLTTD